MAAKITQRLVEVLFNATADARVTQDIVEVIVPSLSYSPSTPTGAGVTHDVVEVLFLSDTSDTRVTHDVIEVLILYIEEPKPGPGSTVFAV